MSYFLIILEYNNISCSKYMNQKTNPVLDKNNNLQQVIRPSVNLANKQAVGPNNNNIYQVQAQIVRSNAKKEGMPAVNRMPAKPGPGLNQPQPTAKVAPNLNNPRPGLNPQNKAPNQPSNLNPNNLNRNLNQRPNPNLNTQPLNNNRTINPNQNNTFNILNKLNTGPKPGQARNPQGENQQPLNQPKPNNLEPKQNPDNPRVNPKPSPSLRDFVPQDETGSVDEEEQNEAPITSLRDFSNNQTQRTSLRDFNSSLNGETPAEQATTTKVPPAASTQAEPTTEVKPINKVEQTKKAATHPSGMTLEEFMHKKQATNLVLADENTLQKRNEEKEAKAVTVVNQQNVQEESSPDDEVSRFDIQYEIWRLNRLKKFGIGSIFVGLFSLILSLGVLGLGVLYILHHLKVLDITTTLKISLDTFNAILVAVVIVYVIFSSIYRFLALACVLASSQIGSHKKVYSYDFDSLKASLSFSVFFEIASLISYPVLLSRISKAIKLLK
ncbi:hypothetical protein BBF99_00100 [Mycoplasmoides gallisepticum]|uniref:hypothetical protein n=1 Tax=Mycoplasmoides gallisepticum TaxID=2096 RepID=UPI0008076246|nr:hypothetical protein [Mycoplasmoides gallisepticum]OBZ53883.1 hypothetical protein BBF99_00100 [Mycoplasmoides gallisepticum]